MSYKNLSSLQSYEKCKALRVKISELVKTSFPSSEKYSLINQTLRASRSSTANIAEGHGRYHLQENIQYCRIARGSLYELMDHLSVALDEKYIDLNIFTEYIENIETCIRIINGYVNYLKTKKQST